MIHKINVIVRMQDCGDGGYNIEAYHSEEELLADHEKIKDLIEENASPEEIAKAKKDILSEDDPYENGYIERNAIYIEVNDDGVIKLAKPLYFHVGQ
jgi:hypothetical protein